MTIDLTFIGDLLAMSLPELAWLFFVYGGWLVILTFIVGFIWIHHLIKVRREYESSIKYVLLAIDVPKLNEQGPKAVEQIFAHLAGVEDEGSWKDRYLRGYHQPRFSLEIISLEGYIQFLIRTPEDYRDLVEAAIYAQYSDAEITEVEDYIQYLPDDFDSNNSNYDLWGTEFILYNEDAYPIRTYPEFEDKTSEDQFKDSMAALLESLGKVGRGEQLWVQWVVSTTDGKDWQDRGRRSINKLIGAKPKAKNAWYMWPLSLIGDVGRTAVEIPYAGLTFETFGQFENSPQKKEDSPNKLQYLTPGEKHVLEAMQHKLSKIPFKVKFRVVYLAEKDIFSKARVIGSLVGAIKQFNTLDMNGFKPDSKKKTSAKGFRKEKKLEKKKKNILKYYKKRKAWMDTEKGYVLNIEELATLFHFPMKGVKAPLLKTTEMRRAEAPFSLPTQAEVDLPELQGVIKEEAMPAFLPISESSTAVKDKPTSDQPTDEKEKSDVPPANLPI
ncbi:MAG: hypothetical protein PHS07_01510 [Patescibacteria group bacterium]|nr:hypothetical protein [Patescibacteria group bacterium]